MIPITAAISGPAFFPELVVLLVASAAIAFVGHRFGIMPIVSFLLTGSIVGPHALGLVHDEALIEGAAELGVILLLFTIGIEFSLEKLARVKRIIFLGGGLQVGLVIALVTGVLGAFGVEWRTGVFTGCLVALSSTAIVMKLLMAGGDMSSQQGQGTLGILIFQDLAVVAMVLLIPMLGGTGGSGLDVVVALGKAVAIVTIVLFAARRIMPWVLEAVAKTCSQEIFLLSVIGICFGTAFLTSLAGVSLSLGAFLAGLVVSESRFSQLAFAEILPLQILFSATFFVSVGLLLDWGFLIQHPLLVLGVVGAVLAVKMLATGISLRLLGFGTSAAACTAVVLAQVGEFSFVLERTGRGLGLYPAGIENGGPEAFIGATVALMIATPYLYHLSRRFRQPDVTAVDGAPESVEAPRSVGHAHAELRDHVIIAGYGDAGRMLARILHKREIPYIIVTLSPDGAREAERGELRVLRGNYTRQHELTLAGIRSARMLVVADDDPETTLRVVAAAKALHPDLRVIARSRVGEEASQLHEAGAQHVVSDDRESVARVLEIVLRANDVAAAEIGRFQDVVRSAGETLISHPSSEGLEVGGISGTGTDMRVALTEREHQSSECKHAGDTATVSPSAAGCEECLKDGHPWVHLRICMTCGNVGCCDSSPRQHGTKHYHETGHPIIKSLEPTENWAWCYEDQRFL